MSFPIGKGIMKELIVVWLISMDPRKKKYKVRDIIKTIETQMELGWSCGEKSRQLLDNPHYDAPGTPSMETEEDQGDRGIT